MGIEVEVQLSDIWFVAGVILGFQITWLSWRISREIKMREKGERTWLPPADLVNLFSMTLIIVGVFILPILGLIGLDCVKHLFGLAVFLIVGHAFALAGHYELFSVKKKEKQTRHSSQEKEKQPRCSFQEMIVLFILAALTVIYIVLWAMIG